MGEDWFVSYEKHGPVRNLLANEEAALDKLLAEIFAEDIKPITIRQKVEIGAPHTSIVEVAEREGADLIVMATHGRTGLSHILLGSVTEKVVARAPCPVLVIPRISAQLRLPGMPRQCRIDHVSGSEVFLERGIRCRE
jgi:nucleotide-binding universal stress UspA family protein